MHGIDSRRSPSSSLPSHRGLRRTATAAAIVALLAATAPARARADGFAFDGDLPLARHVVVDLTPAQQDAIAFERRAGVDIPEIRLTREQVARIRDAGGAEVHWLFAARREDLDDACGCGLYDLGFVVGGNRLAVLLDLLGREPDTDGWED